MNTTNTSLSIDVRHALFTSLAAACLALCATIAHAADEAPGYRPASKIVQYGDLNLANPQAVKRLYNRIVAASDEVCGRRDERSLEALAHHRICTRQSITRAVAAVGNPALAALHAAKTGQPTERVAELTKR